MMLADGTRRDEIDRNRRKEELSRDEEHRRREERWQEQILAQKEAVARPAPRFLPHFDKSSLLKLTKECKDIESYFTVFEAQLAMEEVPMEEWKVLLIGQLDASHRLKVADLVADAQVPTRTL